MHASLIARLYACSGGVSVEFGAVGSLDVGASDRSSISLGEAR